MSEIGDRLDAMRCGRKQESNKRLRGRLLKVNDRVTEMYPGFDAAGVGPSAGVAAAKSPGDYTGSMEMAVRRKERTLD